MTILYEHFGFISPWMKHPLKFRLCQYVTNMPLECDYCVTIDWICIPDISLMERKWYSWHQNQEAWNIFILSEKVLWTKDHEAYWCTFKKT